MDETMIEAGGPIVGVDWLSLPDWAAIASK